MEAGQQPDFAMIARGFTTLGEQIGLCANLPTVNEGQRLLQLLERMEEQVERIHTRLGTMEEEMREQKIGTRARESNLFAQNVNRGATKPGDELTPLRAVTTGEEIESFPRTVAAMDALNGNRVNEILGLLDQPTTGSVAERKRRLKWSTGVFVQAV
ncbi:hypothetical protein HD806DRAFT_541610 [Xylariaceae sp. AK1471]|nr:hypothetical protein HD806DRAFT_541610 [Xylariaceae sp. AK1471]